MTNREFLEKTLTFQPVPHPPFMILAGHGWICKRNGLSPLELMRLPDAGAQITVDAYRETGSVIMSGGGQLSYYPVTALGGEVNNEIVGGAPEIVRAPLKNLQDIDQFDLDQVVADLKESEDYKLSQAQIRNMRAIVGDETFIAVGGYGPFTQASQMVGMVKFMMGLADNKDGYVEKLIRFAAELIMAFNKGMLEAGGDLVVCAEPVASGDLISPKMFEDYVLPINVELMERTREICPYEIVHICGNTVKRVEPLAKAGFNGFSVDSIDMEKAREDAGGRMVMIGNLNPAAILLGMDADGVYEKSRELCQAMKNQGGFILAPGCDLPPDTALENLQAMARAVKEQ